MGKGSSNGGVVASRGFIFQAIVAEIQCLERDDWDAIKVEPETENDKVDIMLYRSGKKLSAIQVKSSVNPFTDKKVKEWLDKLRTDAGDAEEKCLYLVGYLFTIPCADFISKNNTEIKKISFENIHKICIEALIKYIRSKGADWDVRMDDYEFISDALFARLFKNSISKEPISRSEFEERFQKALPVHIIPKCLTPIPTVNHVVGLVGRDDIKKTVRDMLEKNGSMALVNGLGGIGKTAVMQHVCNDIKNEGKYVAWIDCGGSIKEDFLLLRSALSIPESDDANTAYSKIVRELKSNRQLAGNVYMFLDNLSRFLSDEEQEVLNGLKIHMMASSRFKHDYFVNLPLDILAETSVLDMFYGYYLERQKDKTYKYVEAAKEIIESVQSHTLLVELLAKAAAKKGGTLEDFRNDLKEQGIFDVFKRKLSTKHDKNQTIEECVMELYKISGLTPVQQHIMKLFTIFTPEREIYYKIGEWADLDMDAIDELVELGWLEQGGLENGYQIHQIIRDSISRQMKRDGVKVRLEEYGKLLENVINTNNYLGREIIYEKVRERLVLTEDVARFFDESGREDVTAAAIFNNLAAVYHAQGNYDKAIEYYKKARVISENLLGNEHLATARIYDNMADVYRGQGKYYKALEYFEKALFVRKEVQGLEHPDTASTYNNIGLVFLSQGKYQKALGCFEKALVTREKVLGQKHSDTGSTYNNVASVFEKLGIYDKALEYYKKALVIDEEVLGKDHPDTATTYGNLAGVYEYQRKDDKALEYYNKALLIREKVLGMEHPYTAATYNNLAGLYFRQRKYDKALEYYEKALVIREKVLGKDHPDTATTYGNMANVYNHLQIYDKALEYNDKARTILEEVLGTKHISTATTYNNMALVYQDLGNYKKALEYYEKARVIYVDVLGMDNSSTATIYNNIAGVYHEQGNYGKALEYYKKANQVFLATFGKSHPYTQNTARSIMTIKLMLMTGMNEKELRAIFRNPPLV